MVQCLFFFFSDGQITAILDQKNYVEELNRHLRFVRVTISLHRVLQLNKLSTNVIFLSVSAYSASVNNLQAKVDALEKSNTKLTEEVRAIQSCTSNCLSFLLLCKAAGILRLRNCRLSPQLAVANNRIITLQEDVERVKEESSYQLESRKVITSSV